jgi:hypothetical protein
MRRAPTVEGLQASGGTDVTNEFRYIAQSTVLTMPDRTAGRSLDVVRRAKAGENRHADGDTDRRHP